MAWHTEGLKSGIIAADTLLSEIVNEGESESGISPVVMMSGSVASAFELQHRNAANNANVVSHRFFVTLSNGLLVPPQVAFYLQPDERLRVVLVVGLLAGQVQASMLWG